MAFTEKRLGAGRPTDTNNLIIYTATAVTVGITALHICNTTSSDALARVFYVPDGDTADETTALMYDFTIPANDYHSLSPEKPHYLEASGTVVVRSGTGSALTFTLSGVEIT